MLPNLRQEQKLWKGGFRVLAGIDEVGRGALAGPVVAAACAITDFPAFIRHPSTRQLLSILKNNKFPQISTNFNAFRDSKSLAPNAREAAFSLISRHPYLIFRVSAAGASTIDRLNIRRATLLAMRRAALKLITQLPNNYQLPVTNYPITLLIDGIEQPFVVVGQARSGSVSRRLSEASRAWFRARARNAAPRARPASPLERSEVVLREALPECAPGYSFQQYTYINGDTRIFLIAAASIVAKVTRDRLMTRLALKFPYWKFEKHKGYATPLHKRLITTNGSSPIHRKTFIIK